MSSQVIVEDLLIRLEGIAIQNTDVVQYFKQKPEEKRTEALIRAVEVGVFCLQRTEVGQSVEFVKLEVERLIHASNSAVDKLPELIRTKLSGPDSPTAQVSIAAETAQKAIREKLAEVQLLFEKHLDPTKTDATLGQALAKLSEFLDPKYDDSVQKRLDTTLQGLAATDGTIAVAVKATVENAIAPLRTAVETLFLALKKEEGTKEALATTTQKGFEFEEELLPELQRWATLVGADFEYTAPQNQPGDFTLTLKDTSIGGVPLKLVIEARDREQAFGRIPISTQMTNALSQWNGNYGIYVSKTQSGLAGEIGEWSELSCEHGPVVACTFEHLKTALRFAIVDTRLRAAAQDRKELDTGTVAAELGRFRDSLNHLTQIKRKVGEIRQILSILPSIETEADQMRNEIQDALGKVEGLLPR